MTLDESRAESKPAELLADSNTGESSAGTDTAGPPTENKTESKPLDAELRKDLLKSLVVAFPSLLIGMSVDSLKSKFTNQPGVALWFIIPGIALLGLIFLRAATRKRLKLGWPFLVFLLVYILFFFISAETGLLDWKRSLSGYDRSTPNNFLALNRLGDWHYKFASEVPDQKLAIVLMEPPKSIEQGRLDIAALIESAANSESRGVALDFAFDDIGSENPEYDAKAKQLDEYLCQTITDAQDVRRHADSREWPVLIAYDFDETDGHASGIPIDPRLQNCLPRTVQGHGADYVEWDGRVRSVPLYLTEAPTSNYSNSDESLSLKIAKTFNPQIKEPANGLLQFVKPENDFKPIMWKEWEESARDQSPEFKQKLKDRFVIIGENSQKDIATTPYGVRSGAVIHGYAVHSLMQNHFITRSSWWITLLMISLMCYLMMLFTSTGITNVKLILINAGFSILMVGISILAMYVWITWIDVVYPLLATWLFLALLLVMRRVATKMAPAVTA